MLPGWRSIKSATPTKFIEVPGQVLILRHLLCERKKNFNVFKAIVTFSLRKTLVKPDLNHMTHKQENKHHTLVRIHKIRI